MAVRIAGSTFDCREARPVATFWAGLRGFDVASWSDEDGALIEDPAGREPWIGFARVPEGKAAKNRCHLDLATDDLDAEIDRVERLGGRTLAVHRERSWDWNAMTDPEGNELCLGRTRPATPGPPGRDAR